MKTENIEDIYELTPIQKGILFHSLYTPEFGQYFFQTRFAIQGNLNPVAFEEAWQQVVSRHTILRSGFYWEDIDKPLQVVYKQVNLPLEQQDWRELDPVEQDKRLTAFLKCDRQQGFDLSQECQMRLTLFRCADQYYQFIWSRHFLIVDGWSAPMVLDEVVQFYEAFGQGQTLSLAPSIPFQNYIDWLQQQDLSKAEVFWRRILKGVKSPTPLTHLYADDVDSLANPNEQYNDQQITLSEATTAALQSLAKQHQLTLNTLIQGAWTILISRYSGEKDVVYGCTVSGRPADLVGAESIVGMLVNTLPVRVKVNPEESLLPWLKQLQAQLVEMRQYEYSPLVDVQGWSDVPRGMPLFESIVVFENLPVPPSLREGNRSIEVPNFTNFYKINYPITVVIMPGSSLVLGINYDFSCIDVATINGILTHFEIILHCMATHPEIPIKDLSILTKTEQRLALEWEKEIIFDFDFKETSPIDQNQVQVSV